MNLSHPLRITVSQVIVDGNDMNTASGKRVKVCGKRCHERFTFTRSHLGDPSLVKDDTADELYRIMLHVKNTSRGLAYGRICFGKQTVKALPFAVSLLVLYRESAELCFTSRSL